MRWKSKLIQTQWGFWCECEQIWLYSDFRIPPGASHLHPLHDGSFEWPTHHGGVLTSESVMLTEACLINKTWYSVARQTSSVADFTLVTVPPAWQIGSSPGVQPDSEKPTFLLTQKEVFVCVGFLWDPRLPHTFQHPHTHTEAPLPLLVCSDPETPCGSHHTLITPLHPDRVSSTSSCILPPIFSFPQEINSCLSSTPSLLLCLFSPLYSFSLALSISYQPNLSLSILSQTQISQEQVDVLPQIHLCCQQLIQCL